MLTPNAAHSPTRVRTPPARAWPTSSATSRDLPIPASPDTPTTRPLRVASVATNAPSSAVSSAARPTIGLLCRSSRPRRAAGARTAKAVTAWSLPLTVSGGKASHANASAAASRTVSAA